MMNFIKIHMITTSYRNAGILDDSKKGASLSPYLRSRAECLREAPGLLNFSLYMLDVNSAASGGPTVEYSTFMKWANVTDDYAKMKPCSNFAATLKRLVATLFLGLFVA